jgi:hypothetical protein
LEGSDAGLASVLESLEFCLKLRGSEASVLEDLAKAINLVHIRHDLVESGHAVLNHAYRSQQEYERYNWTCACLFYCGIVIIQMVCILSKYFLYQFCHFSFLTTNIVNCAVVDMELLF